MEKQETRGSCKIKLKAEYRLIAHGCCELLGGPTTVHCDRTSAIKFAKNPMYHERTKNVEIDSHCIREIKREHVELGYTSTGDHIENFLTKAVTRKQISNVLVKLGIVHICTSLRGSVMR